MIRIELTPAQIEYAAMIGERRQARNHQRPGVYGARRYSPDVALQCHVDGALGEAAVLKLFAPYLRRQGLEPITTWRSFLDQDPSGIRGDVAGWEVRTRTGGWGSLILHPGDDDHSPFVAVINRCPRFYILGWIWGRDGKLDRYWRRDVPSPAYFVPPGKLSAMPEDVMIFHREAMG